MWQGDVLKAFLLRHRFDIVSIALGKAISSCSGKMPVAGPCIDS